MFDGEYFVELVGGEVVGKRADAFADDYAGQRALCLLHDLLGRG